MRLFKKLRQKIISNKFKVGSARKYLIYALGEILLLVVGILVALQINIKREHYILSQKQEKHLKLIRGEMVNNLSSLENEDGELVNIMDNTKKLLNLMAQKRQPIEINERELSGLLMETISRRVSINHENGAMSELISSGGLKDIKNDSIRSIIASWDGRLKQVRSQEQSLQIYFDYAHNHMLTNGSYRTLFEDIGFNENLEVVRTNEPKSNKILLTSIEFENILVNYLGVSYTLHHRSYATFRNELRQLIQLLEKELKPDDT
ncbi:MAG: hypothetical protein AAFQ94_18165 [Bacteroidota bacterium]